jgi:hypothetical protein
VTIPRWGVLLGVLILVLGIGAAAGVLLAGAGNDTTVTTGATTTTTTRLLGLPPSGSPTQGGASSGSGGTPSTTKPTTSTTKPTTSTTKPGAKTKLSSPFPLEVSETAHDFQETPVGTTSERWDVVISNPGNLTSPIEVSFAGGGINDPFGGDTTCGGNSVAIPSNYGNCRFTYYFKPAAPGPVQGSTSFDVTIVATGARREYTVNLRGTGCTPTPAGCSYP